MPYFYPGDTVTLGAGDLRLRGAKVIVGATVTIQLFKPDGTQFGSDLTGVVSGNDWTIDVNLPNSPPGRYTVKIMALSEGAWWHGKVDDVWVKGF